MKKEIKVTKEQFERLVESCSKDYSSKKTEVEEGYGDTATSSIGGGAGDGLAVIVNAIKKGYNYITDPETKKKAKELFQALSAGAAAGIAAEGKQAPIRDLRVQPRRK
jgi:hypothetical protein